MWNDLTMSERADVIKMAVKAGLRDMKSIRKFYDDSLKYADGGPKVTYGKPYYSYDKNMQVETDNGKPILNYSATLPEINIIPDSKKSPADRNADERFRQKTFSDYAEHKDREYTQKQIMKSQRDWDNSLEKKALGYAQDAMTGIGIGADIVSGLPIYSSLKGSRILSEANSLPEYIEGGLWLAPVGGVLGKEAYNVGKNAWNTSKNAIKNTVENIGKSSKTTPVDFNNLTLEQWTPEQWTAAQDAAIARGDMLEAQRLRDLHFKVNTPGNVVVKNGTPTHNYHGTDSEFNTFDINLFGKTDYGDRGRGFYFSQNKGVSEGYGPNIKDVYLYAKTPYKGIRNEKYLGRGKTKDEVIQYLTEQNRKSLEEDVKYMIIQQKNGSHSPMYDSLGITDDMSEQEIRNRIYKAYGREDVIPYEVGNLDEADVFLSPYENVVYKPNQIKSADAVTYDSNGVRIPLGLRDNFKNKDIRYSISLEDALSNPNFDFSSTGAPRSFWEIMNLRRPSIASEKWKKVANQKLLDSKELDGAVNILQSTWYKKRLLSQGMSEAQANNLIKQQVSNIKATNVILGDPGTGFGMQAGGKTVTVNGKTTIYVPEGYTSQVATHEGLHSSTGNGSILDIKNKVLTPNWSRETNPNYYDYISNPDEQRVRLLKLADYVEQHGGDYAKVINDLKSNSHGIGKPKVDSDFNDLFGSFNIGDIIEAAKNVKSIAVPLTVGGTALSTNKKAEGGSIHIAPSKRGTFTAAATKHGMGVQEFASKVLANKDNYSSAMVKKANFAKNASNWKHGLGGYLFEDGGPKNTNREYKSANSWSTSNLHRLLTPLSGSLMNFGKRGILEAFYRNRGGTPEETYFLPKKIQRQEFLSRGYIEVPNDYGLVKKAVGNKDVPVYQTKKDDISREEVIPIGNIRDTWYGREEAALEHPGHYPTAIYFSPYTNEYYQKGWDLNDYGGGSGAYNNYDAFGKIRADIADAIGSPVVTTTGISNIGSLDKMMKEEETSNIATEFLKSKGLVPTKLPTKQVPILALDGKPLFLDYKGEPVTHWEEEYVPTLPEITITGKRRKKVK